MSDWKFLEVTVYQVSYLNKCSIWPPFCCTMHSRRRRHSLMLLSTNAYNSCCQALTTACLRRRLECVVQQNFADGYKCMVPNSHTQVTQHKYLTMPYLTSFSKSHLICQNTAMTCIETTNEPINSLQLIWSKLNVYNNTHKQIYSGFGNQFIFYKNSIFILLFYHMLINTNTSV